MDHLPSLPSVYTLAIVTPVTLLAYVIFNYLALLKVRSHLPPGPTPLPIIGNLIDFAKFKTKTAEETAILAEKWGDMVTLFLGSTPCVVVNSPALASELMDKRGANYSSRPPMNLFRTLVTQWRLLSLPSGDTFRTVRRIYHQILGPKQSALFQQHQDFESKVMLGNLLRNPQTFLDETIRFTTSVIFSATYGVRLERVEQHPLLAEMTSIWKETLKYNHPGTLWVDYLPFLEYLPHSLQPELRKAQSIRARDLAIQRAFLNTLRSQIKAGNSPVCAGTTFLEMQEQEGISDDHACDMMTMLIQGGSETTSNYLQYLFKVFAMFPDVVVRAQQELDAVVGKERLPEFSDWSQLPYIRAVIKEAHRWAAQGALSVPHVNTTADDNFHGYKIPKGTVIYPAMNVLNYSESRYGASASEFRPERFLKDELPARASAMQGDIMQRDHWGYGFGRRLCPGIDVAEPQLFIFASRALWAFDMKAEPGQKLDLNDRVDGLITRPQPFKMSITPRSAAHEGIIKRVSTLAHSDLASFDDVKY